MLPLAMLTGALFYSFFERLSFLTPYLIFIMLLITFCKLSLREIRFSRLHLWLLIIQTAGSLFIYWLLQFIDPVIAQGTFICIFAPTATAAAVITGMLGGSVASLAAYSLLSSLNIALLSPFIFSFVGTNSDMPFIQSALFIFRQVGPLLILPFICAVALQKIIPSLHSKLQRSQMISFYLWALALTIVMGKTVSFIAAQDQSNYKEESLIALFALIACFGQFILGKRIGSYFNNTISGGQALGQKNTILAIWMAQVYLSPLASIGPASYVLWQNIFNSYQLWIKRKKETE